jgi:hypothetical protein
MSQPDGNPSRPILRRLRLVGGAFVFLAIAVVAYGLVSRAAQNSRLHDLTEAQAVPSVSIVAPTHVENHAGLDLPGRLEAYIRAPIYARVPGYLKTWKYDIGGKVKAGDVLAEIDTPDLDQQLMQARAALSVSQANAKLAQITAERWQSLAGTDAVAKQVVDTRTFPLNATVGADNRVLLKPVSVERDLGAVVELASGLGPNDRVIQNPPDGIDNGAQVRLTGAAADGELAGSKAKRKNEKS